MFAKIVPAQLQHAWREQTVRMACNRMTEDGIDYRRIIIRIPPVFAARLGKRVDVAVGLMGTPDEGMLRITPGTSYSLWRESWRGQPNRSFTLSISVSRGLPTVRSRPVKFGIEGDALTVIFPGELRPHYEDLARRAELVAVGNTALAEAANA